MGIEQDRINRILEDLARLKNIGNKLVYDRNTKTVRPASNSSDPDGTIDISPSDAEHFCQEKGLQR